MSTLWFCKDLISLPVLLLLLLLLLPPLPLQPPLLLFFGSFRAFCLVKFNVPYIFPQCQQSNAFMLLDCYYLLATVNSYILFSGLELQAGCLKRYPRPIAKLPQGKRLPDHRCRRRHYARDAYAGSNDSTTYEVEGGYVRSYS